MFVIVIAVNRCMNFKKSHKNLLKSRYVNYLNKIFFSEFITKGLKCKVEYKRLKISSLFKDKN